MSEFIYDRPRWPSFSWNAQDVGELLAKVRHRQGLLAGQLTALGLIDKGEATVQNLTATVISTSAIEGEHLNRKDVRSSIARRLGIETATYSKNEQVVEGIVDLMLDATQNYQEPVTVKRICGWHTLLFPAGRSGMVEILAGQWRDDSTGPMQVVSGPISRERIHYQAPPAVRLDQEMRQFLDWINGYDRDFVVGAAIAHFWFVTIHPFDDGNGRIARALADLMLARADSSPRRFYSMSAQIQRQRNEYYQQLERAQRGSLDITSWILWFLNCLDDALGEAEMQLDQAKKLSRFWGQLNTIELNDRQRLVLQRLTSGFEGHLTTSKWAKLAKCSPDTALRDIEDLIAKGVLTKGSSGGRSTHYRFAATIEGLLK